MGKKRIFVLDTTLRDGEQQALINFNQKQKIRLAKLITMVGVDFIDIMPISNSTERDTVKKLKEYPLNLSTPLNEESVNLSLKLGKDITLFQAVSDNLLKIRYKLNITKARKENIKRTLHFLKKIRKEAKNKIKIFVVGEDSSRADKAYLIKFLKSIENYADGFFMADSVGCLTPKKTTELITLLKTKTNKLVGIHSHNDLGYADENTVSAVLAGADIISGTFTGIGERAGNANLGNVLRMLKNKDIFLQKIKYNHIKQLEQQVKKFAGDEPAKPFSKEAFYVETGIHVHALLNSPTGYSPIDPKKLGFEHKVFFGKKSGISNFKWYLKDKYSDEEYSKFRDKIKEESIKKNKSFKFEEVKRILKIK